jgi:hypothetical protein
MPGVGKKSIKRLLELGLIEIAPPQPNQGAHYRRTAAGDEVYYAMREANRVPP